MITIHAFVINKLNSIKEALKTINNNAHGICFVVNNETQLVGVITDGDIRRALISNVELEIPCGSIMQKDFTSFNVTVKNDTVLSTLNERVRVVPLVDDNNVPVDFASFSRLHRTPIMEPQISGNELAYVSDCIKTGWISSQGTYVKRFEKEFAQYCGAEYALAVSNGTVALHLALVACGVEPGDEVIVPDITFAASANAIIHAGAIPVFVDVDEKTWTISVAEIRKNITSKTKAIMPVHLYGHPCHMDEIMNIAKENNLVIVEDCAEALGTLYKETHVGVFGDSATFSFFGNKTITTGEGGMILFKDEASYKKAAVLRDHGMSKTKKYWHELVGFNYRMTNVQAAIGCAQLERIDEFVKKKRFIAESYNSFLSCEEGFVLPPEESWAKCGYWLYTVLIENDSISRDELIDKLLINGIETRPMFYPLHQMPAYSDFATGRNFPNSDKISSKGISFPSSVNIGLEEIENIKLALNQIFTTANIIDNN
jgi:perosamine synthetase